MKQRVTMVSYINTLPFLYGLQQPKIASEIQMRLEHPAACAKAFIQKETDIALIPVGVLHEIPHAEIISPYCIGSIDEVYSVAIFSKVPLESAENIWLDYQSRTSALLTRLLLKSYWKLDIPIKQAMPGFLSDLPDKDATLIIGDRAITHRAQFSHIYDLGEIWKKWTGLPFTFAVWVAHVKPAPDFLNAFNAALYHGLSIRNEIAVTEQANYPFLPLHEYLNVHLDYNLDTPKLNALDLFLEKTKAFAALENSEVML